MFETIKFEIKGVHIFIALVVALVLGAVLFDQHYRDRTVYRIQTSDAQTITCETWHLYGDDFIYCQTNGEELYLPLSRVNTIARVISHASLSSP